LYLPRPTSPPPPPPPPPPRPCPSPPVALWLVHLLRRRPSPPVALWLVHLLRRRPSPPVGLWLVQMLRLVRLWRAQWLGCGGRACVQLATHSRWLPAISDTPSHPPPAKPGHCRQHCLFLENETLKGGQQC
jgi:hypothetical protein